MPFRVDEQEMPPMSASTDRAHTIWRQVMKDVAPAPAYQRYCALVLSWEDESDELKVDHEITELRQVLTEQYGFLVDCKKLKSTPSPNLQVQNIVSSFALEFHGKRTLFLIYYAGHGWFNRTTQLDDLHFTGKITVQDTKFDERLTEQSFLWSAVETVVSNVDADILLIPDCCYAGKLCRTPRLATLKRYQVLAACSGTQRTHAGGEGSFTCALVWALRELAQSKDQFDIIQLRNKIMEYPSLPDTQQPTLGDRINASATLIRLRPLVDETEPVSAPMTTEEGESEEPPSRKEFLDVRLHFDRVITEDVVRKTAVALRQLMVQDNDFVPFYTAFVKINREEDLIKRAVHVWRQSTVGAITVVGQAQDGLTPTTPEVLPNDLDPAMGAILQPQTALLTRESLAPLLVHPARVPNRVEADTVVNGRLEALEDATASMDLMIRSHIQAEF